MATKQLGVFNVKTHLSELLDQVERGTVIYITRRGRRVAELRPAEPARRPLTRGCARNEGYSMADDFDETPEDLADYA
jgi:prevent-host-death family protein